MLEHSKKTPRRSGLGLGFKTKYISTILVEAGPRSIHHTALGWAEPGRWSASIRPNDTNKTTLPPCIVFISVTPLRTRSGTPESKRTRYTRVEGAFLPSLLLWGGGHDPAREKRSSCLVDKPRERFGTATRYFRRTEQKLPGAFPYPPSPKNRPSC